MVVRSFIIRVESDIYYGMEGRAQQDILKKQNKLNEPFNSDIQLHAAISYNVHDSYKISQEVGI